MTMIGLGLSLVLPRARADAVVDLYPDAYIAFDPVNSFYKVGSQTTTNLATFLAYPEVHFSADPTSAISASGFLPNDTFELYVDVTDGGNDEWTLYTEANIVVPETAAAKNRVWCAVGVHDVDDAWWRVGLGQFEFLSIILGPHLLFSSSPFGAMARAQLGVDEVAIKKTAATISAEAQKGFYGGAAVSTQSNSNFSAQVFSRFYIGWGGSYQASMAGDPVLAELPSLSYVRSAFLEAALNEAAAAAWTA